MTNTDRPTPEGLGPPPWAGLPPLLSTDPKVIDLFAEDKARLAAEREQAERRFRTDLAAESARMRPVVTIYAGCRFRSRLEARWAVALDTLGIEWQYEPEGFETAAGWYLPDFRLPLLCKWLEIKPVPVDDPRHSAFASIVGAGWRFVILAGDIPDPRELDNPQRRISDFEMYVVPDASASELRDAYRAARSARFEHGETP